MKVYKGKYIADIYKEILTDLYNNPEYVIKPRGLEVREILNCIIEVKKPNMNLFKSEHRSSPEKYIAAELLYYFSGTNEADFIEKYASMWTQLKNKDNKVNSAYGNLIFTEENKHGLNQYEWVIETLKKDKDSRQAFMHFNKPDHQYFGNKDQVCTLTALFHIREDKLHMTLNMRSNDVILGFMTDFTFFNILHQQVYLHLKKYYKNLKMGTYTHTSHSMHLYAKHYELVENMIKTEFKPNATPLLNTSILKESGVFEDKYFKLFNAVIRNNEIKIEKTENDVLNWALGHLKNETK